VSKRRRKNLSTTLSKIRLASEVTSGILVRNAESYELVDGLGVSFKLTVRREENESKVVWLFADTGCLNISSLKL